MAQSNEVQVSPYDENGSLWLRVPDVCPRGSVTCRVPVEADVADADGMTVTLLLHVLDGRLSELEILRADGGKVLTTLDPRAFDVVVMN
jgi:hypothetical protein